MQYYEPDHFVSNQDALIVLGDEGFLEILGDTIPMIPKDILDDVLRNCVFLMLNEKKDVSPAFIPRELIEGKSMCAFCEILYSKESDKQKEMILHEIAHYVHRHGGKGLSEEVRKEQEKIADKQKDKWIDDWEKHLKAEEGKNIVKGG